MNEKPEIKQIKFKESNYNQVVGLWVISYNARFWWCQFLNNIRCHGCKKMLKKSFLFVSDMDAESGFVTCPECIEECMTNIKNPVSTLVKFFEDL